MNKKKYTLKMSLSSTTLQEYVTAQLGNAFPDREKIDQEFLKKYLKLTLERLEFCFGHIKRKYFFDGENVLFDHLYSDQYAMFLYYFSNTIYNGEGAHRIADKLYYLNKSLHGIDIYYEVRLPDIFLFRHCVGTVLGRADYSNYFSVGQNCTVGNNRGLYPVIREKVAMYHGSAIVGEADIGSNTYLTPHAFIRNEKIEGNCIVIGSSPNLVCKPTKISVFDAFFNSFGKDLFS